MTAVIRKMYQLVVLPLFAQRDIYSLTKQEAKEYNKWYHDIMADRLSILETAIQNSNPNWKLDYSRNSLIGLYSWLENNVRLRNVNENEIHAFEEQLSKTPLLESVVESPELTLGIESVSMCFDIGMYFGETILKNVTGVNWIQKVNSTNFIDYAQPLLATKLSKVPVNPRRIAESLAYDILEKAEDQVTFVDMYDKLVDRFSKELG